MSSLSRAFPSLILGLIFGAASLASAKTTIPVVGNYSKTAEVSWKGIPEGYVPQELVKTINIVNPSRAYQAPYRNIFFQNERVVVCIKECELEQPVDVRKSSASDYVVNYEGSLWSLRRSAHNSALKAATTYHWLNRLMDDLATLGFKPSKRLIVRIDRQVGMPNSGVKMHNNAFFYDKDWSLSFLPSDLPWLVNALGTKLSSPALDPSVVMHEAMHSVFHQLIGPIVNREIYSLHEAFADYFPLEILQDARLGMVFMAGKTMRDNSKIPGKHTHGMPAHDAGNIVSAALWKIRAGFSDKGLAKKIALRTIVELGRYPYYSTGDVARVHQRLCAEAGLTQTELQRIASIWGETGLVPGSIDFLALTPPSDFDRSGHFTFIVSQQVPDSVTKQWAQAPRSAVRISLRGQAGEQGPAVGLWEEAEVTGMDQKPHLIRVLLDHQGDIRAAFAADGSLIEGQHGAFEGLKLFGENQMAIKQWNQSHYEIVGLYTGDSPWSPLLKIENAQTEAATLTINGQKVQVQRVTFDTKAKILGHLIGAISPESAELLKGLQAVALYTVDGRQFPTLKTLEVAPNRRLVGISKRMATGIVENSILSSFDTSAGAHVLEPSLPKGP